MEKVINPKKAVFLFNADHPKGEMFTLTQEQLEAMQALGFDMYQGYHLAMPVPIELNTQLAI